jgi:para-nitrobenzyl esterase
MRTIFGGTGAMSGLVFVLTSAILSPGLSAQNQVSIETGRLQGVTDGGVTYFKGIPYAASPVGSLRWRPPQPAERWKGIRSAAQFGNNCMQVPSASESELYRQAGAGFSEDCLFLNVWAPANRAKAALPVMIWIYGGGFTGGGTSLALWNGAEFARGGVVLVSFNYRLGRFGFFAHPALTHEDPNGMLGNYGYMDQLAALKWVQKNIAAFGGDPHNVTLFGESAGGISVHALMNFPLAKGLFQKAIIESGGGRKAGRYRLHEAVDGKTSGEEIGLAFARSKGISAEDGSALERLRALPAESIVEGVRGDPSKPDLITYSGPMIDGKVVTEDPQAAYLAGTQPHIPVIVGANSAETGVTLRIGSSATSFEALFAPYGTKAAAASKAYNPERNADLDTVSRRVQSDTSMVEPARFVARALSHAGQPVWEYRFSYVAESMRKLWSGAPHNTEQWYVFDTLSAPGDWGFAPTPSDEKMAQTIHAYWIQFAKTGNPNGPGLPPWSQYSTESDKLMNFTNNGADFQIDAWKDRLDLTRDIQ